MIRVDHAAPLHDGFCRCRRCKPPLVGQYSVAIGVTRLAAMMLSAIVVAFILIRVTHP